MKCSECGKEEGSVRMYSTLFKFSYSTEDVFSASFNKSMCKDCITMNIKALTADIEFLYEDMEIDESSIVANDEFLSSL